MDLSTLQIYNYKIKSAYILFDDKTTHKLEDDEFMGMRIMKQFDTSFLPIVDIDLYIDEVLRRRIISEKLTTRLKVRIQKYTVDRNAPEKTSLHTDYFDETFVFIIPEDDPFLERKLLEQAASANGTQPKTETKFFIYKEESLLKTKTAINQVLNSSNMLDAITYILNKSGIRKVLFQKPDNDEIYPEILIPPSTAQGAILFLNESKGIYKRGLQLFFDLERNYICSKPSTTTSVYEDNESLETIFYVPKVGSNVLDGSFRNGDRVYVGINFDDISINNASVATDQLVGNKIVLTRVIDGVVETITGDTKQLGEGTVRFAEGGTTNNFTVEEMRNAMNEGTYVISVTASNIDVTEFTPNKVFAFIYADKDLDAAYGGKYRLVDSTNIFSKSGSAFTVVASYTFKKISV